MRIGTSFLAGLLATLAIGSGVVGCGKAGPPAAEPTSVTVETPPATPPPVAPAADPNAITVEMSAATLADDCGGAAPFGPPAKGATLQKGDAAGDHPASAKAKRRCEQTSMQLAIKAPAGATPADIAVKEVELFDPSGASIGKLQASAPRVWSAAEGVYVDWNQKVAPGSELSVSYALSAPVWTGVENRFDKTYVVKAVLSIAGADHPVQTTVEVKAPTSLPPGVKT